MNSKTTAVAVVYAALYSALVIVLGPFSYGPVQLRVADAMVALIPIFGWAGILGQAIGVFISNIFSPIGWIDLLNTIPSFIMAVVIWKLRNRSVIAGTVFVLDSIGRHRRRHAQLRIRTATNRHIFLRIDWKFDCINSHRIPHIQGDQENKPPKMV